jgi:phage shock protein A
VIFKKFWSSIRAQLNKLANVFWEADPIAQMRYEYDAAVEELKSGRVGLEQYRGLVEQVTRQVREGERHLAKLQAQTKAYLKVGDRETAARFALEVQKAKAALEQNREQLATHETAYENNLKKIKHANKSLADIREKIERYDAELKMSEAEAEIAKLSESFDFNVTTDFGELEQVLQSKIDKNRGAVRVASDLSERGIAEIDAQEAMEASLAEDALRELELEMGLVSPATVNAPEVEKQLGPVAAVIEEQS